MPGKTKPNLEKKYMPLSDQNKQKSENKPLPAETKTI